MNKEIWRTLKRNKNYQVSNLGRVRSLDHLRISWRGGKQRLKGRILKLGDSGGYDSVSLSNHGNTFLVHRLIAETFIKNTQAKRCVNHINGDKKDNRVINLSWCSYSENEKHSYAFLGKKPSKTALGKFGIKNCSSKQVLARDENGNKVGVYGGVNDCARIIGGTQCRISANCLGITKTSYGYKFSHITKKEFYLNIGLQNAKINKIYSKHHKRFQK